MPKKKQDLSCGKDYKSYIWGVLSLSLIILVIAWGVWYYQNGRESERRHDRRERRAEVYQNNKNRLNKTVKGGVTVALPPAGGGVSPIRAVAEAIKPSVVNISALRSAPTANTKPANLANKNPAVTQTPPNQDALRFADPFTGPKYNSVGSGIVVNPDGYILTNYHVIEKATDIKVVVFDAAGASKYTGRIIREDPANDLALIKLDGATGLIPAALGNSDLVYVGDYVMAVGSPWGLDQTVTAGIISNLHQSVVIDGVSHSDFIQTDTPINQGNSGGPLVNMNGEVVGINTAIYTSSGAFAGVGFSVPVNKAKNFVRTVISLPEVEVNAARINALGKNVAFIPQKIAPPISQASFNVPAPHPDWGRCDRCHTVLGQNDPGLTGNVVTGLNVAFPQGDNAMNRPWLGADVQSLNSVLANQFNSPVVDALMVNQVFTGSPAEAAGIMEGDIIFKIDGRWIRDPVELTNRISSVGAGNEARISLYRNGKRIDFSVLLTPQPRNIAEIIPRPARGQVPNEFEWVGMEVSPLTKNRAVRMGIGGQQGMLVLEVEGLTPAADAGMAAKDIITSVNRMPVTDGFSFQEAISTADITKGIVVGVKRGGRNLYLSMR